MESANEFKEVSGLSSETNFYIIPGSMSIGIQKWQEDFKELLPAIGIKKDNIHLSHLSNIKKPKTLFGPYKDWRKASKLPSNPEDAKKAAIIAHSSGTILALRYAEHYKNAGLVLFSPYPNPNVGPSINKYLEKYSEMFNKTNENGEIVEKEFDWEKIAKNSPFIIIVHSKNDNLVSEDKSLAVYNNLKNYKDEKDVVWISSNEGGHYPIKSQFPEFVRLGKIFERFNS